MVDQQLVREFEASRSEGGLDGLPARRAERPAIEAIVAVFPGARTIEIREWVDALADVDAA